MDVVSADLRFDLAFASLPGATLLVGEGGQLESANGAAIALLGDDVAAAAREVVPVGRALPWIGDAVSRVLAGTTEEDVVESEVPTRHGRRRIAARLKRMHDGDGTPRGAVALLEDLTTRARADGRLRSAERLAALGTLLVGLAREVNNPLSCVVAGISFVESEHDRLAGSVSASELGEAKLALGEAREAARRVARIVSSLQSFCRPAPPLLRPVELAQVLREAVHAVEPRVRACARVVADVAPFAPVRGSEPLLLELFMTLIESAAPTSSPAGRDEGVVRVTLTVGEEEARVVVASAAARFAEDAEAVGTRPGVSVCRGIVSALGGSLALNREPDGGGSAVIVLPLDTAAPMAVRTRVTRRRLKARR